jgi:uncharacterized membrane protein YfcA
LELLDGPTANEFRLPPWVSAAIFALDFFYGIPVLVLILRLPVRMAAGVNMLVGFFTVVLSFARRYATQELSADEWVVGGVMAAASVAGSAIGVLQARRIPVRPLKIAVCAYLALVGVWMVVEAFTHAEHILLEPTGISRWALAAALGFVIALVSGPLGVAGGEMRIPALMYLFGLPVKIAGTVSLLASIPTVAAGALAYRRLGHLPNGVLTIAIFMGAGSLVGVLVGAWILPLVDKHTVKALLGAILLLATVFLSAPSLRPQKWRCRLGL